MRNKLRRREFIAFLFVSLWGVIGHFIFDWSGENPFLGAIFAVNESTWEHMKLLYLPLFLFAMLEYISLGESIGNFFAARFAAALLGLATIPMIFYTLNSAFGKTPDWLNIALFFFAAALSSCAAYFLLTSFCLRSRFLQLPAFLLFWLLLALFIYFTYRPPMLPLFRDPVSGLYGIPRP